MTDEQLNRPAEAQNKEAAGHKPGADPGPNPDLGSAPGSGLKSGANPGSGPGSGVVPGSGLNSGANPGSSPGSGVVPDSGLGTGACSGKNPSQGSVPAAARATREGSAFARYVSLNILGMLGLSCYILADTFFIANGVGSDGLAALNLVLPVYSFINGTGLMLGMGGATAFSICRGEGDDEHARSLFTRSLLITLIFGALPTAAGLLGAPALASLLGADSAILPLASLYLRTLMMFSYAFLFNNILLCFVRNDGGPGLAMCAMLIGSLCNVVFDYILVFPMKLGMFGAALATGVAPLISMGILSLHWIRGRSSLRPMGKMSGRADGKSPGTGGQAAPAQTPYARTQLPRTRLPRTPYPLARDVKRIVSLGIPSFITEFSSGVVMVLFNFTILSLAGNTGVAAYGIIANLALIVTAVFTGEAQGAQPLLSLSFGRGERTAVSHLFRMAVIVAVVLGGLACLTGQLFTGGIVAAFNRDGDALLAQTAISGIRLYFPAFLISGVNIIVSAYFSAVSQPKPAFFISILRGFAAITPAVLILPRLFGMTGVWLSVPLAELITLAAALAFGLRARRRSA